MATTKRSIPVWELLVLLGTGVAVGCGGPTGVKGQITFAGKPVESGSISFEPADGKGTTAGGHIEGGTYELVTDAGLTPGKKIVRIRGMRKTGRKIEAGPPLPKGHLIELEEQFIPTSYNDKSTLTTEIAAGKINEVDFHLKPTK